MALIIEQIEGDRIRTYSDAGMMIARDGIRYCEAVDPADKGRVYIETDVPIVKPDEEATEADKDAALRRFGVEVTNE